jgi:hypothetical protein
MKFVGIILLATLVSGCCTTKVRLVPQAYMPEPPAILMRAPQDLQTIRKNSTTTEQSTEVETPKND